MKVSSEEVKAAPAGLSWLDELAPAGHGRIRLLGRRDEANETARAAFMLGRERGYAAGIRAGTEQGYVDGTRSLGHRESQEAAGVATKLHETLGRFQEQMAGLESQIASDLVSLAIDIARQVLRRELTVSREGLIPVAIEALRAIGEGASHVELRVHPDDAALLREHLENKPGGPRCHLQEDYSILRGGLRLEADSGVVDATFEARWQAVMMNMGRDEEPLP
ncbi:MAG: flagellar assembly protein FliH [Pseudomonadota bacterium]